MLCRNCQRNVKSDFKYCPYCGERIISDYHDHYAELTPPPIITMEEPDGAAAYYAPSPDERGPRFEEDAFVLPDFEDESPDYEPGPAYAPEPPYEPPYDAAPAYEPEPTGEPSRGYAAKEPSPYFVYDPNEPETETAAPSGEPPAFRIPRIKDADELPRGPVYRPPAPPVATGPSAATKLLAISLSLFGGVAAGVLFYQLLTYLM